MNAERAGIAWACPFSSSDEFEAAVISSRRRAGAYRPASGRRFARFGALAFAAVVFAAAAVIGSVYFLI